MASAFLWCLIHMKISVALRNQIIVWHCRLYHITLFILYISAIAWKYIVGNDTVCSPESNLSFIQILHNILKFDLRLFWWVLFLSSSTLKMSTLRLKKHLPLDVQRLHFLFSCVYNRKPALSTVMKYLLVKWICQAPCEINQLLSNRKKLTENSCGYRDDWARPALIDILEANGTHSFFFFSLEKA